MNDTEIVSHTYELLRKMRAEQQDMRLEMQDMKVRLAAIEEHMQGTVTNLMRLNAKEDRVDERLARIERRGWNCAKAGMPTDAR